MSFNYKVFVLIRYELNASIFINKMHLLYSFDIIYSGINIIHLVLNFDFSSDKYRNKSLL